MTLDTGNDKVLNALNWAPVKKVSQAAFDEAVQDNIDALDMTPEEAVTSAVEEFTMQGVDMSDIIMTPTGGDISTHPAQLAIDRINESLDAGADVSKINDLISSASELFTTSEATAWQQNLAVAVQCNALRDVLLGASAPDQSPQVVLGLLRLARHLLQSTTIRDSFADQVERDGATCHGPDIATWLLSAHSSNSDIVEAIGGMCTAALRACEPTKCKLMDSNFPRTALRVVDAAEVSLPATAALLMALKGIMTNDDLRPPASKAFMHARMIAIDHSAVPVFLGALKLAMDEPEVLYRVISSLQQLCANEEICKSVCELRGVHLVLAALSEHFSHSGMVASTCGLLRQLTKSDDLKTLFVEMNGLDLLNKILSTHKQSAKACTQALGLMASVLLRQPEHCEAAFALPGLMDNVVDTMREHGESPGVMRQACQAVRNLVVRNESLRKPMLDKGVEPILRASKKVQDCDDVALAALRDLGLDNYKD